MLVYDQLRSQLYDVLRHSHSGAHAGTAELDFQQFPPDTPFVSRARPTGGLSVGVAALRRTSQSTGHDLNDSTTVPAEPTDHTPIDPVPAGEPIGPEPLRPTFADLGLSDSVLRAIAEMGYRHPTPIQEQAIPTVLMGRDVLGTAQTGTGKTAGFTLPMLDILTGSRARARMPRSLILEPTRELALQVSENFVQYGK